MDKKTETRLRRKKLRLKASAFVKRNGLYIALAVCLAVIGGVAATLFAGGEPSPAEHSYDERLGQASTAEPTKEPAPTQPPLIIRITPAPTSSGTPEPTMVASLTPAPSREPAATPEPVVLTAPVDGAIIRVYAMDFLIYSKTLNQWMTHPGVDIASPKGAEVRTVMEGTVESVTDDDMLGTTVVIAHPNGMRTVYANLKSDPPVTAGQKVESRAVIGNVGDTAISECAEQAHLHFELYIGSSSADPEKYVIFASMPD